MNLNKITDKQGTSYLHITQSEILTIDWTDGKNLIFYAFDKSKNMRVVDKEYFGLSTVGKNYKKIEEQLYGSLEDYCSTKGENGDIYFAHTKKINCIDLINTERKHLNGKWKLV
jgi:hypothetical protein